MAPERGSDLLAAMTLAQRVPGPRATRRSPWRSLVLPALALAAVRQGVAFLQALAPAAAPKQSAMLGSTMRAGRQPRPRVQMAGFFEDIGAKLKDAAIKSVTGMSEAEWDEVVLTLLEGKLDFNTYLQLIVKLQDSGGAGGMMQQLARLPGLKKSMNMDDSEEATAEREASMDNSATIVAAMTEEERTNPDLFLTDEKKEERCAELAEKVNVTKTEVENFVYGFGQLRRFFYVWGKGHVAGKSNNAIMKMLDDDKELALGKSDEEAKLPGQKKKVVSQSTDKAAAGYRNPARAAKRAAKRAANRRGKGRNRKSANAPYR